MALLDLVGDVGYYLHRPAEVVAATLFRDHRMVDPAGRVVILFGEGEGRIPFVVAKVEIGFRAVVRHVDFPVLVGIHRAGIDVDVRVKLEEGDLQPSTLEQVADRGRGKPFPQGRDDPARDKNEFAHRGPHLAGSCNSDTHGALTWKGLPSARPTPAR